MAVEAAKIEVFGVNGKYFLISGQESGHYAGDEGVLLRPKLTGAIDAPVKSLWLPGAFGQVFVDFRWDRRDMVFTVQTFDPDEDTPEGWHTVDSDWRYAWDYVKETEIRYTTSDGVRSVFARLLEEPKAYDSDSWEGKDPHLYNTGTVVMTVACELPFYQGVVWEDDFTSPLASGSHTFIVPVDGDVPVWPKYTLTDQAIWTLPDHSFGNEEFARGVADANRTVPLPFLPAGAGCVVDSDPRRQTLLAANRIHLQGLWGGKDLLYPLPHGTHEVTVSWTGATDGVACAIQVPQWFTRPWSRPTSILEVTE